LVKNLNLILRRHFLYKFLSTRLAPSFKEERAHMYFGKWEDAPTGCIKPTRGTYAAASLELDTPDVDD
jgi:hypothetical protein